MVDGCQDCRPICLGAILAQTLHSEGGFAHFGRSLGQKALNRVGLHQPLLKFPILVLVTVVVAGI
jgi:hypothetical protein